MSKNEETYNKQDLFQSGKAYRNSIFGQGENSFPEQNPQNFQNPQSFPYNGYPQQESNLPVPAQPPGGQDSSSSSPASFLANLPVKDIKNVIDRMGGIEGVMNTMTKVNKMMQSFQQMAPMIKLLLGSFMKGKKTDSDDYSDSYRPRRKRRRRRRKTSSKRKTQKKKSR
jgi:hypothetical protein